MLERCDLVRPLGHVRPHMCSLHASLVRRSPAEPHAILCVGGGTFCEPVNTLWSPLLLLCWQLRFFEFLCDAPGSALYVCCECDHNWVMCVGMKNHTLENECIEKMVFRTERVECRSVGRYDGRLKLSVLHTLCITDYIT